MEIYELADKASVDDVSGISSASSEEQIEEVLIAIADQGCTDPGELEIDSLVDVYYGELLEWVSESESHVAFAEDAVNEGLVDTGNFDFYAMLQAGQYEQYKQYKQIAHEVFEWLEEDLEEREEEEEE